MLKKFTPFAYANSIYEIDFNLLSSLGIKVILVDLDNTLVPYSIKEPTSQVKELKAKLDQIGISLLICSNNKGKRVGRFATMLGIKYFSLLRKPFSGPLLKAIKKSNLNKEECILIGDQLMTDIACANKAKIKSILVEPLNKQEPPWTKFNRLFDKPIRKKLRKKGLLKPLESKKGSQTC